ncbi:hypothetical protein LJC01_02190 [Clostridiaceae bacterium OttesenSCG-928-D20]|nr:hypothetical protein [Clostridiaceae bacterium OttesenSCG-928-D20]
MIRDIIAKYGESFIISSPGIEDNCEARGLFYYVSGNREGDHQSQIGYIPQERQILITEPGVCPEEQYLQIKRGGFRYSVISRQKYSQLQSVYGGHEELILRPDGRESIC